MTESAPKPDVEETVQHHFKHPDLKDVVVVLNVSDAAQTVTFNGLSYKTLDLAETGILRNLLAAATVRAGEL